MPDRPVSTAPPPVLRVTRYDVVSSWMLAFVVGLCTLVGLLTAAWYATRLPRPREPIPVELIEITGGVEDGAIDSTLQLESPAELRDDATLAEVPAEETEVQEVLENVLELADDAVNQADRQFEQDTRNAGRPGSARGTGRRALGQGPGDAGGFPREQRWFIRYADEQSLDLYARQLDHFGIELGAIEQGRLHYLSRCSDPRPRLRTADSGGDEQRLYMTWQGGQRRRADLQLFARAGLTVGSGLIFQFYPPETEQMLAQLEQAYRGRAANQIRRTYFAVRGAQGGGFEFYVTKQTDFQ